MWCEYWCVYILSGVWRTPASWNLVGQWLCWTFLQTLFMTRGIPSSPTRVVTVSSTERDLAHGWNSDEYDEVCRLSIVSLFFFLCSLSVVSFDLRFSVKMHNHTWALTWSLLSLDTLVDRWNRSSQHNDCSSGTRRHQPTWLLLWFPSTFLECVWMWQPRASWHYYQNLSCFDVNCCRQRNSLPARVS